MTVDSEAEAFELLCALPANPRPVVSDAPADDELRAEPLRLLPVVRLALARLALAAAPARRMTV